MSNQMFNTRDTVMEEMKAIWKIDVAVKQRVDTPVDKIQEMLGRMADSIQAAIEDILGT